MMKSDVLSQLVFSLCSLAYALNALHVIIQHHREAEHGAIANDLMLVVVQHFESLNASASKAALEVFIQLNRRQKVNINDIFLGLHTGWHASKCSIAFLVVEFARTRNETPCANLVRLLSHADVDVHQRALTLLNAVVQHASTSEGLRSGVCRCRFTLCFVLV